MICVGFLLSRCTHRRYVSEYMVSDYAEKDHLTHYLS